MPGVSSSYNLSYPRHVIFNSKWRRYLHDVRFYRGADAEEEDHDVDSKWNTIKNIYCETAQHVVGYRQDNREWLTPCIL